LSDDGGVGSLSIPAAALDFARTVRRLPDRFAVFRLAAFTTGRFGRLALVFAACRAFFGFGRARFAIGENPFNSLTGLR
jgi:hypothetical protein